MLRCFVASTAAFTNDEEVEKDETVRIDMTYRTYASGLLAGGGGSLGFKGLIAWLRRLEGLIEGGDGKTDQSCVNRRHGCSQSQENL